jgi:hypothetical protein
MSKASLLAHATVGVILLIAALYTWTYENLELLESTKIAGAPVLGLLSIVVLLLLPLHYAVKK